MRGNNVYYYAPEYILDYDFSLTTTHHNIFEKVYFHWNSFAIISYFVWFSSLISPILAISLSLNHRKLRGITLQMECGCMKMYLPNGDFHYTISIFCLRM